MIKIENVEVMGWEAAIRGMRNPMNSWEKSDSGVCATHGPAHCADCVYTDCHADDVEIGTVANSCSTMHKIHEKEFTLKDFSYEHLLGPDDLKWGDTVPLVTLECVISALNVYRQKYLETQDKQDWWQMIQLLPSSYNQRRTVMLNYEVLANIYKSRCNHKLDEWRELCTWIESLPYSELITGELDGTDSN